MRPACFWPYAVWLRWKSEPMPDVTVAIPVRDGGALFARTLEALSTQTIAHDLLVCDSRSSDGSPELARAHGARVIEIDPAFFSHGGTRNLLMSEAFGAHVALLTQDAEPADARWLERLLAGFELAPDVGLVCGPYLPRPDAALAVRLELERWFASLAPDGAPRVDRLDEHERGTLRALALIGPRGFFSDANACIARAAWQRAPFREVAYAEDRLLAIDMLRAGFARAYLPDAAVVHSHAYTPAQELRRCFDEWRGLREVYGWREPLSPPHLARRLRGELGWARRELDRGGASPHERRATLAALTRHHVVRLAGALLGSRADRLPPGARRRLSLEGRSSFEPLHLDTDTHATDGTPEQIDPLTDPPRPMRRPPR
jgi:GT2 family glycosyltransferase